MTPAHYQHYQHKPFRSFVNNAYWACKDEYDAYAQQCPYTFAAYLQQHLSLLKQQYRAARTPNV